MQHSEVETQLAQDPGNPVFAEYADQLRKEGQYSEALEVCYRGLSANPSVHRGRLVLARVYYEKLYWPFAIREVQQLQKELPHSETLKRLLTALAPEEGTLIVTEKPNSADELVSHSTRERGGRDDYHDSFEEAAVIEDNELTVAEAEFEIDDFDLLEDDK